MILKKRFQNELLNERRISHQDEMQEIEPRSY